MNASKIVYSISEDPYVFDKDKNNLPALTSDNVKRINFMIHNDSNYRFLDENNRVDSIQATINKYGFTKKEEEVLDIVKIIDKQILHIKLLKAEGGVEKAVKKQQNTYAPFRISMTV